MAPIQVTFPALLDATEEVSAARQKAFFRATAGQLALLAASTLAALIPSGIWGNVGPLATMGFFLGALILQVSGSANKNEREWYGARAASESIKTASWEFAVGGEAFRLGDATAEERYILVLKRVLGNIGNLDVGASTGSNLPVTESMKALRASQRTARAEAYYLGRTMEQTAWYSDKAAANRRRSKQFGGAVVLIEMAALIVGGLRINGTVDFDYLGPMAACAAGLIGWMQAKKYANLAEVYAVTSHEVSLVPATLRAADSEEAWAQAVHDAEAAFSREHTMWQARRQGPIQ